MKHNIDLIDYNIRSLKKDLYEKGIDYNVDIYPFIFHIAVVNWNGSGKDILLNADIYNMYFNKESIFDDIIKFVFNRPFYKCDIKNIYSNAVLNKELYSDDYYLVNTRQDLRDCEDGILYLHDAEQYFNSIGMNLRGEDGDMIKFINNKRKDGISFRFSLHRFSAIHVRVRELIPCWLLPDLYCLGDNIKKLNDYIIKYKVCNCDGFKVSENILNCLPKYAFLYDTLEKAEAFS